MTATRRKNRSVSPAPNLSLFCSNGLSAPSPDMHWKSMSFTVEITTQHPQITAAIRYCNCQSDTCAPTSQRLVWPGYMHLSRLSNGAAEIGSPEPSCTGDVLEREESGIYLRGAQYIGINEDNSSPLTTFCSHPGHDQFTALAYATSVAGKAPTELGQEAERRSKLDIDAQTRL